MRECPFCAGREDRTPPETLRLGEDPWQVRVVPNLYPAFERHEIVIHCAEHVRTFAELSLAQTHLVGEAWRRREAAAREEGYGYVHAFVNEGPSAGASLAHSHSQLVWLRDAPPAVRAEADETCRLCELVSTERSEAARLVAERDGLVAICPAAGRAPFEALVTPIAHRGDAFGPALGSALDLLAALVGALRAVEGPVPWNAWLHAGAHWHLELVPRLSTFAGIELGAGIFVLTVAPEHGAAALRSALEAS
ncbi:MAG: galactose-1-phosphate uridylyltransferase [Gaiellaceae bacterium]|nr:MAG: galactose-1-phosphate uridylyltransferase [Gaiellaceae bacterium]